MLVTCITNNQASADIYIPQASVLINCSNELFYIKNGIYVHKGRKIDGWV